MKPNTIAPPKAQHTPKRPRTLVCCCCGKYTKGRQWWNRDTGYGLCDDCIPSCGVATVPMGETAISYGVRGFHWDVSSRAAIAKATE